MKIAIAFSTFIILLLMVFLSSSIIIGQNRNHTTPLIDVGASSQAPSVQPSEPTQSQPTINPDGTKNFTVDLIWQTNVTFQIGGSHFSLSKFTYFTLGIILQEMSMEIIKQLAEHVRDIAMVIVVFLAFITMPLVLVRQKIFLLFYRA